MAFNQAKSTLNFLQAERSHQSRNYRNSGMSSASTSDSSKTNSIAELVRCVCGCTSFTKSDLETMLFANMDAFMNNPASKKFYQNVADPDPQSDGQRYMRIYEMCQQIQLNNCQVDEETRDELLEMCPTYLWEQRFEAALEAPETELQQFLKDLQAECKFKIESSKDYQRYREILRDKCKKLSSLGKN